MKASRPKQESALVPAKSQSKQHLHPLIAARVEREGAQATELGQRMLRIESDLYFALDARGHVIEAGGTVVDGERIQFWLYEADRQTRVALKPKDWGYRAGTTTWRQVLVPSGRPTLVANPSDNAGGGERRWTDKGKLLEAQIERIVDRFETIAKTIKERRARHAQIDLDLENAMRRAARRLSHEREELARPKRLRSVVNDWHEVQRMHAFLDAMEARLATHPSPEALTLWLDWARNYADALDPLSDVRLARLQAEAESIEYDPQDLGEPDPYEGDWREMGMLDEYT